jgi:hypothetical protein
MELQVLLTAVSENESDHEILVISSESESIFSRTALSCTFTWGMKYEHTKPYKDWF